MNRLFDEVKRLYYYRFNDDTAREYSIIESCFCDVHGNVLCLGDTVSWHGKVHKVSLISGKWCLTRRKSDSTRLLDVEDLNDVVEKDLDHLILIK